ncbi:MAG: M14 family zinc carboxypeptidase [Verrucomicrobiae bacterium]
MLGCVSLIFSRIFEHSIGRSVEHRDIMAVAGFDFARHPAPSGCTLLIGGIHGDEAATIVLLESFAKKFLVRGGNAPPAIVIPLANPDSRAHGTRYNARGVDINRNFGFNWHIESEEPPGPEPWSEPETRALRDLILKLQPAKIVSLHWALAEIDADGPQSTCLAGKMWDALDESERRPYRVRVSELGHGLRRLERTYEICPGSLGQWCGYGLRYADGVRPAMITLELPYDPDAASRAQPPPGHLERLREHWRHDAAGYLAAVESGVHKMLAAACDRPAACQAA